MKHGRTLQAMLLVLVWLQTSAQAGECISSHEAALKFVDFFGTRKVITLPLHRTYMDEFSRRNPLFAGLFHQGKTPDRYDSNLYPYKVLGSEVRASGGPLVQEMEQSMTMRDFNAVGPSYVVDIPEYYLMVDCSGRFHAITAWITSDGGGEEVVFPPACEGVLSKP